MSISSSRLLKQASSGFLTKVIAAALAFIISIIFARQLGPNDFGIYAMTLSVISLVSTVVTLGLPMLVVRQVAIYSEGEQWGLLKGIIYRSYQWTTLTAILVFVVLGLITFVLVPSTWQVVSVLGLIMLPFLALNQIRASILRGLHWVVLADVPELLFRPLLVLIMIGISLVLVKTEHSDQWAIGIQLIATFLSFLIGAWLLKQRLPRHLESVAVQFENKIWLAAGITFLGVALVSAAEGQVALLLLGSMAGAKYAGLYQAAFQLVTPIIFGLMAVNMALQSKLAAAWSAGDKQLAQRLVTEAARLSLLVALMCSGVLLWFAEECLALFGDTYREAAQALKILVLGQLFNAAAGSCGIVLSMTGHQREVLRGVALALIVNFVLCMLLIPHWSIVGAAVAASSGLVMWNAYLMWQAKKLTGIRTAIIARNTTS
jgi:O-antigen/teichoic acid export membrane protein